MSGTQQRTSTNRLRGLSQGLCTIRARVASERAASVDHRMEALALLGHLPED